MNGIDLAHFCDENKVMVTFSHRDRKNSLTILDKEQWSSDQLGLTLCTIYTIRFQVGSEPLALTNLLFFFKLKNFNIC